MVSAVANRYARALADVVMEPASPLRPPDAVEQLRSVEQMLKGSAELRTAMMTPAIQSSRKRAVMGRLLTELGVSSLIRNFVYILIDRRRIGMIEEMREAFELLVDERLGFARAEISSAAPLDQRRGENLESELSGLTGKRMRLHFAVDAALLGGIVARIGSKVYDGSLRGQLRQLQRRLTEQAAE